MTTVSNVLSFLNTLAPQSRAMDWDNGGLLCGRRDKEVHRILVALDPFEDVAAEAAEIGAELIVTHHPLIFHPITAVTDETAIGRTILLLAKHDIAAINLHTNLDLAPEGVNDVLSKRLGLENAQIVEPTDTDDAGRQWGLLRCGTVAEQPLEQFLQFVKDVLGTPVLRYADGGRPVHRVACGGGSCADEIGSVSRAGCDTFVTSDAKYNDFWDARDLGITLIDAGHFYTENPVCTYLCRKLEEAFPEIEVAISKQHRDCMKFF